MWSVASASSKPTTDVFFFSERMCNGQINEKFGEGREEGERGEDSGQLQAATYDARGGASATRQAGVRLQWPQRNIEHHAYA